MQDGKNNFTFYIMDNYYSSERNVQILVALLKSYGIRYVIVSPGTTNINFVASVQCDPFFKVFSSVDERSAAYLACGIASESGEPVVLSCTGATASRNYLSGLTEAYYRKLPVLAVTSTQNTMKVGHLMPQVIDRSNQQADTMVESILLKMVWNKAQAQDCEIKVNKALLALRCHGGGPVHINLETAYSRDYSLQELPAARMIKHIMPHDEFPTMPSEGRIACHVESFERVVIHAQLLEGGVSGNVELTCTNVRNPQVLQRGVAGERDVIAPLGVVIAKQCLKTSQGV